MKSLPQVSMLLAVGGVLAAVQAPQLPPPFHSESVNNGPVVIARPEGVQLKLPPGFKIEVAAEGFEVPRFMLRGPSGEILLSDSAREGAGAVVVPAAEVVAAAPTTVAAGAVPLAVVECVPERSRRSGTGRPRRESSTCPRFRTRAPPRYRLRSRSFAADP